MQTFFDVCCVFACRATLNINNSRRGYWVSGLIFVSWKYNIYQQMFFISFFFFFKKRYSFIHFYTENVRLIFCFLFFRRRGNKRKKVNQKPNISSCLTSSEAVMNYVWYQATLSKTIGLIVWFFKLFWLSFVLSDILSLRNVASIVWIL